MTTALKAQKHWKVGDHSHVCFLLAVVAAEAGRAAFAVLVTEDARSTEDIALALLENPNFCARAGRMRAVLTQVNWARSWGVHNRDRGR